MNIKIKIVFFLVDVQKADVKADLLKDDFDWVRHIGEDYFGPHRDKTQGSPQGNQSLKTKKAIHL